MISWEVDWTYSNSLHNWVTWLDLYCVESYQLGIFGSLYFLGFLISCLIFPPLSDKYGRRNFFMLGALLQLLAISAKMTFRSKEIFLALMFVLGFSQPMKSMIAYSHLMEFLPRRESKFSGIFLFFDGLVVVISPLLIWYVSQDLTFFLQLAFSLNLLAILLFLIIRVPESLKFLL